MDQKKFLSDFLSGCSEAAGIREEALVAASKYTVADLSVFICKCEEEMETQGRTVALEHAAQKYTLALAAKEAWEELTPFQRMVPFPPNRAGYNPGMMKNLLDVISVKVDVTESVSLEQIKGKYPTWKKKFLELMKKTPEPSEKELQVSFARLLGFWSAKETDIRQFVDLKGKEADIMVQEDGNEDFVFVEIKKNKNFTMPRPVKEEEKTKRRENRPLVAAMQQNATYALQKAIWGGKTGKQIIKLAVMSLPWMMSRLGSVEVDLDKDGMLVGKGKLNIGILQIWKSVSKDQENPAEYSLEEEAMFHVLFSLENNEEEARAKVEALHAKNLLKEEKRMAEYIKNNNAVLVDEYFAAYEFVNYTRNV
ncbi:MAG: uncharacterized protein A8A55_2731 [Amphiamblys sp. WSBS2006]|nr:MAG: uncharacterized protein A8A55_2731 [Amphiamblys sp. WSBS2006]